MRYAVFCDGACRGNPGVGGFGVIVQGEGIFKELKHAEADTTNNRMELSAAIAGFEQIEVPGTVTVVTDSQYVVKGMTEWVASWQRRGWTNSKRQPVLNRDLWERLIEVARPHKVVWQWVRGHAGHAENERCDELANEAMDEFLRGG